MNPRIFVIAKFIGCWVCIVGAVVEIVLGHQPFVLPAVLATLAIAFALAPTVI